MEKTYQPENIERQWYENWESKGYFRPSGEGDSYSIAIPPPNVTGSLHMGHAFQHTIMDTLTRFKRMQGRNALWTVGTDHAGIATQVRSGAPAGARGAGSHSAACACRPWSRR